MNDDRELPGRAHAREERRRRHRRRLGWAILAMIPLAWLAATLPGRWARLAAVPALAFWVCVAWRLSLRG